MTGQDWQTGWYGKVPCTGDFIRSGLSAGFISSLDLWLQRLMTTGREVLEDRWLSAYMTAPIWRFSTAAGVLGHVPCAGVIMPSVDRVGRQFPLCLAVEFPNAPAQADPCVAYRSLEPFFPALEDAALVMLDDGASLDLLDERVKRLREMPTEGILEGALEPNDLKQTRSVLKKTRCGEDTLLLREEGLFPQRLDPSNTCLWVSAYEGLERVILTPGLPEGPDLAAAFFDLDAGCWQRPDPSALI